jgi:hypothetical protein
MSRSGYSDDIEDPLAWGRWRAQVRSAMRGKRGQAFLKEMLAAMDAMPEKVLHEDVLFTSGGEVCAMGAVVAARGLDVSGLDAHEPGDVGAALGIARQMAAEIAYMNDEANYRPETPEQRFWRMRAWIVEEIIAPETQIEKHQ